MLTLYGKKQKPNELQKLVNVWAINGKSEKSG